VVRKLSVVFVVALLAFTTACSSSSSTSTGASGTGTATAVAAGTCRGLPVDRLGQIGRLGQCRSRDAKRSRLERRVFDLRHFQCLKVHVALGCQSRGKDASCDST
jgi:hypothetical protein